jgi:branched-subunit amino acid transport protein AzlD
MSTGRILWAILLSAVITFFLRALPFLFFSGKKRMPKRLAYLGRILPSTIMAVLIVYCLKDIGNDWIGVGIPRLIAVGIVAISYKWKHNTLLSILGGTAGYMILLHLF